MNEDKKLFTAIVKLKSIVAPNIPLILNSYPSCANNIAKAAMENSDSETLTIENSNNLASDSDKSLENIDIHGIKRKSSDSMENNHVKKYKVCSSSSDEDAINSSVDSNIQAKEKTKIKRIKKRICSTDEEDETKSGEQKLPNKVHVNSGSSDLDNKALQLKKKSSNDCNLSNELKQSDEDKKSCDSIKDGSLLTKGKKLTADQMKSIEELKEISVHSDSNDSDSDIFRVLKESNRLNPNNELNQSDEYRKFCNSTEDGSVLKQKEKISQKEKSEKKLEKVSVDMESDDSDFKIGLKRQIISNDSSSELEKSDEDRNSCDSVKGKRSSIKKRKKVSKKGIKSIKKSGKSFVASDSSGSDNETLSSKKEKSINLKNELKQSDQVECSDTSAKDNSVIKEKKKHSKKENKVSKKFQKRLASLDSSDSNNDTLAEMKEKRSNNNLNNEQKQSNENASSDESVKDNSFTKKEKRASKKENNVDKKSRKSVVASDSSDSDNETLDLKKEKSINLKIELKQSGGDDCSDASAKDNFVIKGKRKHSKKENKVVKKSKKSVVASDSSDSDSETLDLKKENSIHLKSELKQSDEDECSDANTKDNSVMKENKKTMTKKNKMVKKSEKVKKNSPKTNNRIEHLKKYARVAGIRVPCYSKFFEKCKTLKSKVEKMLELFHEHGLKGKPTLQKCKKLRKKIETRKEFAELDQSNIITSEGRCKRGFQGETIDKKLVKTPSPKKIFSRLKDIFDSEESD